MAVTIITCKKGEEDPTISFRSRTTRLCGNWTMKALSGSHDLNGSNGDWYFYTFFYDKSISDTLTISFAINGYKYISQSPKFSYYMEIFDDHTMKTSCHATGGGPAWNTQENTTWFWIDSLKSKECVELRGLNMIYDGFTEYKIAGLSNEKLKLELGLDVTFAEEGVSYHIVGSHIFEFEKIME